MRHRVRMSTTVQTRKGQETKLAVFEVIDFESLESELKRQTRLLVNEGHRVLDQNIVISKMRTSY